MGDAGDGSAWSADHAKYHGFFRQVVESNGFDDALLVDPDGNVVYTAYKGVDLGTNLLSGPYKDSGLETAFRDVLRSNTVNDVRRSSCSAPSTASSSVCGSASTRAR